MYRVLSLCIIVSHCLNGKTLYSQKWKVPLDFEEIDEPKEEVIEEETIEDEEIV